MKITKLWEQKIDLLLKYDEIPLYNYFYTTVYNNAEKQCGMIKDNFISMKGIGFWLNLDHTRDFKHRIIEFYKQFEDYTIEEFTLWLKMKGY